MRLRSTALLLAMWVMVAGPAPAHADIGTHCSGWRSTGTGVMQNACYDRGINYLVRGRGKAYYAGGYEPEQMNVAVSLQRSADGTSWTTIRSATCGFVDGDIDTEAPGNVCLTGTSVADGGFLYRTRVFVLLFWSNGAMTQTAPSYSGMTT